MFRLCANVVRTYTAAAVKEAVVLAAPRIVNKIQNVSNFSTLLRRIPPASVYTSHNSLMLKSLVLNTNVLDIIPKNTQTRSLTKFSLRKGKKKTVKAVIKRFYRLHWGIWIRTRAGRFRQMWKKSQNRRKRLRQHVFTNSTQSYLLDKMVTKFWRKPKYWVNNPYEPYNTREEYFRTSLKPRDYWKD